MNRHLSAALLVASLAAPASKAEPVPPPSPAVPPTGGSYSAHDFDFLTGRPWKVHHRKLAKRGVGSDQWLEFDGTCTALSQFLGGTVNVDESHLSEGRGGLSFRVFNPETRRWKIYWVAQPGGELLPPVEGGFEGGRGQFFGDDEDGGRPVRVRFLWTLLGPDQARWEQAFSYAGGPWETNWVMEFRR
jgi:hypothetical protein